MRFIKLAIISVLLLAVAVTAISLLLPSTVAVTRGIDINAPADSVYKRISELNRWSWLANKDSLTVTVKNDNKTLLMGDMKVDLVSTKVSQVQTSWQVKDGEPMIGVFNVTTEKDNLKTVVQWEFVQQLKWYPWEKFSAAITDKVLGPFMEESLKNLKENIEE